MRLMMLLESAKVRAKGTKCGDGRSCLVLQKRPKWTWWALTTPFLHASVDEG